MHAAGASADRSILTLDSAIGAASDTTPFVGRSNEYGLLIGLIARLTAGTGDTVLIEGEPGIGKSRLLREVARYAEHRTCRRS